MASGESYEREIVRGRRHFKLRASPLSSHRRAVAGAVLLFDDITELVEARRALKRGEAELRATLLQAQSASAAKSLFLSNMSHEFRTPLNAIMGFSEVISKEIMGPVGQAKYKEYALDIHTSAEHLRAIISRVLDLTKVEAGKLDLSESVCDAGGLVGDAARMLVGSCNTKGVILEAQVPKRPLWLRCDPAMVRQIVINLAHNAVAFSKAGQVVRIKLLRSRSRQVKLIVCDRGIGMTGSEIEVALRPFGQIRNPQWAVGRSSGLGLGLPLVKCMAELHGARFEMKSRKGLGTTATVQFPPERSVRKRPRTAPANTGTA
jgi:signal transduction histidine kinase